MSPCETCGSTAFAEEWMNEVFQIQGKPVLIEDIPTKVCHQCGEVTFSRDTTERIRQLLHESRTPLRSVNIDVYGFQAS